jgi:hypothetical protein
VKPNGMVKKDEAAAFGGSEGLRGGLGIKNGVGVMVLDRDELANTPKVVVGEREREKRKKKKEKRRKKKKGNKKQGNKIKQKERK